MFSVLKQTFFLNHLFVGILYTHQQNCSLVGDVVVKPQKEVVTDVNVHIKFGFNKTPTVSAFSEANHEWRAVIQKHREPYHV